METDRWAIDDGPACGLDLDGVAGRITEVDE
jgi:hypothetical protein